MEKLIQAETAETGRVSRAMGIHSLVNLIEDVDFYSLLPPGEVVPGVFRESTASDV